MEPTDVPEQNPAPENPEHRPAPWRQLLRLALPGIILALLLGGS